MHIAVTGNIGAGKTTLTTKLAEHYGWEPKFESVEENPYLEDFYKDMRQWSFALQIYFLGSRFRQILEIRESGKNVVQDRTIYEDAYIFARNLRDMELLSVRDYENYLSVFGMMKSFVPAPDLLIYLKSDIANLVQKIQKRGREYESSISIEYLNNLNNKYEDWIQNYSEGPLLIIETDHLDFVSRPEDFGFILERIESHLHPLL